MFTSLSDCAGLPQISLPHFGGESQAGSRDVDLVLCRYPQIPGSDRPTPISELFVCFMMLQKESSPRPEYSILGSQNIQSAILQCKV